MLGNYFLFLANSELSNNNICKLQWQNVNSYKDRASIGEEGIFENILVERSTSKVQKLNSFYFRS